MDKCPNCKSNLEFLAGRPASRQNRYCGVCGWEPSPVVPPAHEAPGNPHFNADELTIAIETLREVCMTTTQRQALDFIIAEVRGAEAYVRAGVPRGWKIIRDEAGKIGVCAPETDPGATFVGRDDSSLSSRLLFALTDALLAEQASEGVMYQPCRIPDREVVEIGRVDASGGVLSDPSEGNA